MADICLEITAYKLFRVRKDGTIGPLFINRKLVVVPGQWMEAESHPTKGFALRPGWHCTLAPVAPHLKTDLKSGGNSEVVQGEGSGDQNIPETRVTRWNLGSRSKTLRRGGS